MNAPALRLEVQTLQERTEALVDTALEVKQRHDRFASLLDATKQLDDAWGEWNSAPPDQKHNAAIRVAIAVGRMRGCRTTICHYYPEFAPQKCAASIPESGDGTQASPCQKEVVQGSEFCKEHQQ